jgi:hypothetical protein
MAAWAIALWLGVGVAGGAAAAPITLMFDGPLGACGEPGEIRQCGVAEADALASGIPISEPTYVVSAADVLHVIDQDVHAGGLDPFSPITATSNSASSSWTVQNVYPHDLIGDTYLLFTTTAPYPTGSGDIEYDPSDVGLSIDPDLGWVLIHTSAGPGEDYYFPAMSLGSLVQGEVAPAFDVNFVVDVPLQRVGNTYVLPRFRTAAGFQPIPEPGTATLLGLGLVLLAALRRERA